jgi:hypothetical protein
MQSNGSFRPSSIIMEVDSGAISPEFARKETDEDLKIVLSAQKVMGGLENGQFDINVENEEFLDEGNLEALQNELGETLKGFKSNYSEVSKDSIVDENIIDSEVINEEQPQNVDIEIESEINKSFGCFGCNTRFERKRLLIAHVKTLHENETPFQCSICPSKFGKESHLVQHNEIVHEGKKSFQCTLCQTNYETIEYVKQHVAKVHEKKKSFDCSICQSKFALKGELKSHKLKQYYENHRKFKSENKFYKCSFCSVGYASEGYLNRHSYKRHTIKCPMCPSRFDESCNLQKHIDLLHSEKLQPQVHITRINIKPDKSEGLSKNAEPI